MNRLLHKLKRIRTPYEIRGAWLSTAIPRKKKWSGLTIRLKKYPESDEVVELFRDKKKKYFYKTVAIYRYSTSAFPDYAYWDNGKNYDFVFSHTDDL